MMKIYVKLQLSGHNVTFSENSREFFVSSRSICTAVR